jgi:rhodanese-related sulfurtransferase
MRLLLFCIYFLSIAASAQTPVRNVDAAEFNELRHSGQYVLIDLRTPGEIQKKGKIPGATEIDYLARDSEKRIAALDKSKKYLLYCAGGGRSSDCGTLMHEGGFTHIVNLEAGFDDWKKKGFPVEEKKK